MFRRPWCEKRHDRGWHTVARGTAEHMGTMEARSEPKAVTPVDRKELHGAILLLTGAAAQIQKKKAILLLTGAAAQIQKMWRGALVRKWKREAMEECARVRQLPEMPAALLDWTARQRDPVCIKLPCDGPPEWAEWGVNGKEPWSYKPSVQPLSHKLIRDPELGTFGQLCVYLVYREQGPHTTGDDPNQTLGGYGTMWLFASFQTACDDLTPSDHLIDCGGGPYRRPLPQWAQPWDRVANGGFPIPNDMWAEITVQLAYKRHKVFNRLLTRYMDIGRAFNDVALKSLSEDQYVSMFGRVTTMVRTYKHKYVDNALQAGTHENGGVDTYLLLPRTREALSDMLDELLDLIQAGWPDGQPPPHIPADALDDLRDFDRPQDDMQTFCRRLLDMMPENAVAGGTPNRLDEWRRWAEPAPAASSAGPRVLARHTPPPAEPRLTRRQEVDAWAANADLRPPTSQAQGRAAVVFQKHWRGRKERLAWVAGKKVALQKERLRRQKYFANLVASTAAEREAEFRRRKMAIAERARKQMDADRAAGNSHAHTTTANHGKKKGVDRSAERRRTEDEQDAHKKWSAEDARTRRTDEWDARQAKAAADAAAAREAGVAKAAREAEIAHGKRLAERWQHAPVPVTLAAFVEKRAVPLSSVDAWKLPSGPAPNPDQEDGRSVVSVATTHWPLPTPSTHAGQRAAEHGANVKDVQRTMKNGPVELSTHSTEGAPRLVHRGAPGGFDVVTDATGEVAITVHPAKASKASERARRASRNFG